MASVGSQFQMVASVILVSGSLLLTQAEAKAGDISPLNLPSQRQQIYVPPGTGQTSQAASEQFYADFERQARNSKSQWNAWSREFERRRDRSRSAEERNHYQRLLGILDRLRSEEKKR